ncbi:MAG: methyltransferase domain-containing protein [Candidatus Aenigmarchaeota archaeon]|nr:methyltransferase domain-containing protein [Candidatus Aenigmarchaeota archaeon]
MEERVLIVGKEKSYLLGTGKVYDTKYGKADLRKVKIGQRIKVGKAVFSVLKPSTLDLLLHCKRGPQVILPKDAAAIVSITGAGTDWKVIDSGGGSGWLSIFLSMQGCSVTSYERDKGFFEIANKNAEFCGVKIKFVNKDFSKAKGKVDLVTLDLENPDRFIKKAFSLLKTGGWVAVYCLHAETLGKVWAALEKAGFSGIKGLENIQKEWQYGYGKSRPKTWSMAHTGFLVFGRKV